MAWFQIRLTTHQPQAEPLSDLLMELGAASVTLEDAKDQPLLEPGPGETPLWDWIIVVGLFDNNLAREPIQTALTAALDPEVAATLTVEELQEQNWVRAWMDDFHPMQFGQRLWIVPSWSDPVENNGINILLDPGLAFGTGTHSTTALCLEWLDAHPPQEKRVIDFGCGSGILAIAAAKLGAKQVHGVDNDPQALTATLDNAEKNGISAIIETYLPKQFSENEQADLLLANILAGPLMELAPQLANHVIPGGAIVLSGILEEQAQAVADAYTPWFEMAPPATQQKWVRLEGYRREDQ